MGRGVAQSTTAAIIPGRFNFVAIFVFTSHGQGELARTGEKSAYVKQICRIFALQATYLDLRVQRFAFSIRDGMKFF